MQTVTIQGAEPLLSITGLKKHFDLSPPLLNRLIERKPVQHLRAVDGPDIAVPKGKTLSLVGESGCGKSTVAKLVVGLYGPTEGKVVLDRADLTDLEASQRGRRHFADPAWMPPGKVLEMATIDAAHALGLGDELGSPEAGKTADIVLVDMRKPRLYPPNMPLSRLTHFATAADVDTVICDGRPVMENRRVLTMDAEDVLDAAQAELTRALERTGLAHLLEEPAGMWGASRFEPSRGPAWQPGERAGAKP